MTHIWRCALASREWASKVLFKGKEILRELLTRAPKEDFFQRKGSKLCVVSHTTPSNKSKVSRHKRGEILRQGLLWKTIGVTHPSLRMLIFLHGDAAQKGLPLHPGERDLQARTRRMLSPNPSILQGRRKEQNHHHPLHPPLAHRPEDHQDLCPTMLPLKAYPSGDIGLMLPGNGRIDPRNSRREERTSLSSLMTALLVPPRIKS